MFQVKFLNITSVSLKKLFSSGSGMADIRKVIFGKTFIFKVSILPQIDKGRDFHLSRSTLLLMRLFKLTGAISYKLDFRVMPKYCITSGDHLKGRPSI